jgi:hypothetical protein
MKMARHSFLPLLFLFFMGTFIVSSMQIKTERKQLSAQYALNIASVPPKVGRLIAGEFNGLMADFNLLQIGSFSGSGKNISSSEWQDVILGYDQIMELDPYFEQTYLQAQSDVAWDARLPNEAIRLLDVAKQSRPWDFRPGYFMGFDYYYFLDDYDKASNQFLETAKVENAPVLLALLGSRFSARGGGRTQASLLVLENMLNEPDITENNAKEIKNRILALKGVMMIENAVKTYEARFGVKPGSLDRLMDTGIMKQLPPNPYASSYTYDPLTYEVRFDGVSDIKK